MNPIQTSYKPFTEESQELLLFLFYSFPPELVANSEFRDLPRNPRSALRDPATLERIHSKQFLKDMTEMTAYIVWKFLSRKGWMETYSGYSPAYILAHMLHTWMDYFYTVHEDIKPPEIIRRNLNFRWLTMGEAEDIWRSVVWFVDDYVPGFREIIAIEEEYPSFMDFDLEREGVRQTRSYIDFLRKWTHGQTKHPIMLTAPVPEPKLRWLDKTDLKIDFERFLSELKPKDRQIIALRLKGKTVVEVAEIMGYKTHSAVVKRLQRIREKYNAWFGE